MSELPNDLKYTSTHEWARMEDDGTITVGISDHAQELLGDLVFVELPDEDSEVKTGEECAVVESVKAASDVYAPMTGTVIEVNEALQNMPGVVNSDPYGEGWLFRLRPENEADYETLLDVEDYKEQINQE